MLYIRAPLPFDEFRLYRRFVLPVTWSTDLFYGRNWPALRHRNSALRPFYSVLQRGNVRGIRNDRTSLCQRDNP